MSPKIATEKMREHLGAISRQGARARWNCAATIPERFEDKIYRCPMSGCWLWLGHLMTAGYGQFYPKPGVKKSAHRVAYELYIGPIPDGLHVLHHCDVRPCVNPAHLFAGTHTDNMRDMVAKGRFRDQWGERSYNSKLTTEDVLSIRADQRSNREIAADFGITKDYVSDLRRGYRWGHIPLPLNSGDSNER